MTAPADAPSAAHEPSPVAAHLPINLGQFVKLADLASTGGEAKLLITSGQVQVNGVVETRRGRKLAAGDVVISRGRITVLIPPELASPRDATRPCRESGGPPLPRGVGRPRRGPRRGQDEA